MSESYALALNQVTQARFQQGKTLLSKVLPCTLKQKNRLWRAQGGLHPLDAKARP